jgi:hypothetical protein
LLFGARRSRNEHHEAQSALAIMKTAATETSWLSHDEIDMGTAMFRIEVCVVEMNQISGVFSMLRLRLNFGQQRFHNPTSSPLHQTTCGLYQYHRQLLTCKRRYDTAVGHNYQIRQNVETDVRPTLLFLNTANLRAHFLSSIDEPAYVPKQLRQVPFLKFHDSSFPFRSSSAQITPHFVGWSLSYAFRLFQPATQIPSFGKVS